MARSVVLALAFLASAFAAEEVCAGGQQCAEGAEEAALLQSTAAQKLAEVKAHSPPPSCTYTPAKTCNDNFNYCYYDPVCSSKGGSGCIANSACRFCGNSGTVPQCPCPGGNKSCGTSSQNCLWHPGCVASGQIGCKADGKNPDCQFCDTGCAGGKC